MCANITVPLNYNKPKKDHITVGIRKIAAKDPTSSKPYLEAAQNYPAAAGRYITPKQDPVTVRSDAKIILLSNTYDAATPLSGALAARKQFPNFRLILIDKAIGHGVEDYVQCQLKILSDYFTNNTLPADAGVQKADVVCFNIQHIPLFESVERVTNC